jgi:hypothetical protein
MPSPLTVEHARESLRAHLAAKGVEICQQYGPGMSWDQLLELLQDRQHVRYPCEIRFDSSDLLPGEFAHPMAKGERPEDGFVMCVHPAYEGQLNRVPLLVLYQLVLVNYGEFVSAEDAETFGAACLGLAQEDYYQALCGLGQQVDPREAN